MHYERNTPLCPKCGGETYQDSVDVGVGVICGPRSCIECGWSEAALSAVERALKDIRDESD